MRTRPTEPGDENRCAKHTKSMYESRRARLAVGGDENNEGFWVQAREGISVRVVALAKRYEGACPRDDFVSSGERTELEWLRRVLKKKFVRRLCGKVGFKSDDGDNGDASYVDDATKHRRIAARANFWAQDTVDIDRVCHKGSNEENDIAYQRRREQTRQAGEILARYARLENGYKYRYESEKVVPCTDSGWAGCRRTRRSTSGGCIHSGQHMLKFWSKTQAVVALSSAKAELGAAVKKPRSPWDSVIVERRR